MSQATLAATPYLNSNLFSGYYLDERVDDLDAWDCDDAAREAFGQLQRLWELEGELVDSYNEDELLDSWIDEVLDVLGFGTLSETTLPDSGGYNDRLLFGSGDTRRDAARQKKEGDAEAMYGLAAAVLEAKQWNADFTERFAEHRSYRDASHQIKYYLERTPERVRWGVLTDGRKWRLYGTKDYATETYYEVDLPELLESGNLEAFKYFYVFFRPAAFEETAGTSFLDTVWSESETAAQELGEDLQDNVFTALRVLGEGFVATNDLDIDPDDEAARDELKEQSLVLLYRLMFVLYAESRGLIHPDDPAAEAEYEENFSLTQLRSEIHSAVQSGDSFADYSEFATSMWSRLQDLFGLVDAGEQSLGIPPYNGGLFDDDAHEFLAEHEVADRYIAEVVYRLGTTEDETGEFVLADYADLDTRHLGTIYEGLLEHEFRIAPEQYAAVAEDGGQVWKPATEVTVADAVETVEAGGLYVVNDEGERKATGAYYTPDYVVAYIVEETVDPLIAEIKEDLAADGLDPSDGEYFFRFLEGVRDLRVLDPAMGSGHFLTKATGYLTEQVMEVAREQEVGFGEDEIRRKIAKECIYGVDVNGMAVELAKLSMWLETLAADQPLAFLDHHLKTGNSLVGSDITEVLSNGDNGESGQLTLMQAFDRTRRRTLDHVMDRMQELLEIDNENLEDIKSMEEIYADIRADPLYKRLFELASVHTAEQFGLDVPENTYERMAGAIEDEDEWTAIRDQDWFASAQTMADEESFFHWKLEFPEVFFDIDGEEMEEAGFDAVVGNPPYAEIQILSEGESEYYRSNYDSTSGNFDLYVPFLEKGIELFNLDGRFGYILPNKLFRVDYGENLRQILSEKRFVSGIVDFGSNQVFSGSATTYTTLLFLQGQTRKDTFTYWSLEDNAVPESLMQKAEVNSWTQAEFSNETLSEAPWNFHAEEVRQTIDSADEQSVPLGEIAAAIGRGTSTGCDEVFELHVERERGDIADCTSESEPDTFPIEQDILRTPIHSTDFGKFKFTEETDKKVIWPYNSTYELLSEEDFASRYPKTWDYLKRNQDELESRADYAKWYDFSAPRNLEIHDEAQILVPLLANSPSFSSYPKPQSEYILMASGGFGISLESSSEYSEWYVLSLLNSSLLYLYLESISNVFRGGYITCTKQYVQQLPIRTVSFITPEADRQSLFKEVISSYEEILNSQSWDQMSEVTDRVTDFLSGDTEYEDVVHDILAKLAEKMVKLHSDLESLNLSLLDHLGSYSEGQTLAEVGLTQPPEGSADSIFQQTAEQRPNLRVGEAEVVRESDSTVEIRLTARHKPSEARPEGAPRTGTGEARGSDDDPEEYETDQWGYTETEPLPALRITDLTAAEADLIEAFVPVAVDEAGGFAGFRETATKTNSLVDRLRTLTLPAVADVRDGLESYRETVARAEDLDAKIRRTDDLIDEIVYELYGLTDEEIEIVEEAVGN